MTDRGGEARAPIGVFDSGVGGLTVLRALCAALPGEDFLYLGDTARLPYGTKSSATVVRYAVQAADELVERDVKCLVIACNTAAAAGLAALRERYAPLPVIGVIEPGAAAAAQASRSGRIAVLATEGTVRGGAYQQAIGRLRPEARVQALACPLFVALAEEGWTDGAVAKAAAERYLQPLFDAPAPPDTLVLGCTHFPVLREVIAAAVPSDTCIVDSAATTASALHALIAWRPRAGTGQLHFLATDSPERFARIGSRFLGRTIGPDDVTGVDL
ncbi:MAG: glutamate racemase [Steroidobacteraceae bacterium]|jgi:glutamate racemase